MNKKELIGKYEYMSHACFRRVDTLEVLKDLRQLDEPEKTLKLKDVIKRIKEFDDGTKFQWTYSILKELGSDFGSKMFHEAYQQGRFDEGIEAHYGRDKVEIPQFVADWIEECGTKEKSLLTAILYTPEKVNSWVGDSDNQELFARAWLDGYTIEEKRYMVKMKGLSECYNYLNYDSLDDEWYFTDAENGSAVGTHHTRKKFEDAGFGEVFDSTLFEVEEVE